MNTVFNRALTNQYKKVIKERDEFAKYTTDPDNIGIWYVKLHHIGGNKDEFVGGEYLVKITAPPEFPMKPPHFEMLTPNGVYGINCKVCISIGEFHAENYRATLGIGGFIQQLVSGFIGWDQLGGGISILKTTIDEKIKLAAASKEYNKKNHQLIDDMIETAYLEYSKHWPSTTTTVTTTTTSTSVNTANTTSDISLATQSMTPVVDTTTTTKM